MQVKVKVKNRFKGNVIKTVEIKKPEPVKGNAPEGSNDAPRVSITLPLTYSGLNALNEIGKTGKGKRGK
jgi:hypothetical protein